MQTYGGQKMTERKDMKYIIAFVLVASGYAASNPVARDLFVSQPTWAFVVEGVVAYIAFGFPAFLNSASYYVRHGKQVTPDTTDMINGTLAWCLWPAYFLKEACVFTFSKFVSPASESIVSAFGRIATSYGRNNVDKTE